MLVSRGRPTLESRWATLSRRCAAERGERRSVALERFEVIIVGGGIAGASLAHFLAERGLTDIVILERESQPGYHATGRSAGVLAEIDLVPSMLDLKILAAPFLREPPPGFSGQPLLDTLATV